MSGNSAAFAAIFAGALVLAGSGGHGAAAQGPRAPETRNEAQNEIRRAQRELTAAEAVLRDAREARVKIESAAGEILARIDERRRNAGTIPDDVRRVEALRAIAAEEKRARDDIARARAAETNAEQNAETAALALARVRSGNRTPAKAIPPPIVAPLTGPKVVPAPQDMPQDTLKDAPKGTSKETRAKAAPSPASTPPATTPAPSTPAAPPPAPAVAPPAALDALILARMDVEAAEAAFARARASREEAERASGKETRELARMLAETVELKKHAEGARAVEASELEASLKARLQAAAAKLGDARAREGEARAALDSARAREAKARAEIEARIPAR